MITSMKQRHKIFLLLTGIATICFSGSIQAAGKSRCADTYTGNTGSFLPATPGEILKAEGFNEFRLQPVTAIDFSLEYLKRFDIIILTAISLTGQQENSLFAYVKAGGNLIAFRPGNRLTSVLVSQVQPARLIQGISPLTHPRLLAKAFASNTANTYCFRSLPGKRLQNDCFLLQ